MKIQFFLLLNLLILNSGGQKEQFQIAYSGNDLEIVNEIAPSKVNPKSISGILTEPQVAHRIKQSESTAPELQPVSGRGITINTGME